MRILITKEGEEIVEQLELHRDYSVKPINKLKHKNKISSNKLNKRLNKSNPRPVISRNEENNKNLLNTSSFKDSFSNQKKMNSINDIDDSISTSTNPIQYKLRGKKKIFIPKYFMDKYEASSKSTTNIIGQTPNFLPSLNTIFTINSKEDNDDNNNKSINGKKYFSFKQIIPSNTLTNIKKKVLKDKLEKEKDIKINEQNFRTIYKENPLGQFNDIINQPIFDYGNIQLIKYFNQKKDTSPLRIKQIVNSNPSKLEKINKICQTITNNKENEKIMYDVINEKIKYQKNTEKLNFYNNMKLIKNDVEGIKKKLDKYKKKIDEKERYKDLLKQISLKYWNKYDFDKLNKKSTPKTESKYLTFKKQEDSNYFQKNKFKNPLEYY